jgi:hypothetical protein
MIFVDPFSSIFAINFVVAIILFVSSFAFCKYILDLSVENVFIVFSLFELLAFIAGIVDESAFFIIAFGIAVLIYKLVNKKDE